MCRGRHLQRVLLAVAFVLALWFGPQCPALADGGPILSDPQLWSQLQEGQQIAVVSLGTDDRAQVDLFVSMLDRSGESHEITYFVPLGASSAGFKVAELTSLDFDNQLTQPLDARLRAEAARSVSHRRNVRWALWVGTLLINGGGSWPVWALWALAGCAPAGSVAPVATYQTPGSSVSVYGLDQDTDLQALIQTTGLDPAVQQTLARLEGQRIAVVKLRTQPQPQGSSSPYSPVGQPGLHLSWSTTLQAQADGARYAYPLGTGSSWAHPIELTRVYVTASPGVDFSVQFPRLGPDRSGYTLGGWSGSSRPTIQGAQEPAHAIENAVGDWGRVWRVTYMQSNSSEDVTITRLPVVTRATQDALGLAGRERAVEWLTWLLAIAMALGLWLVAWRYTMPNLLGVSYRWRDWRLYRDALAWSLLYPLTNGIALVTAVLATIATSGLGLFVGIPLLLVTALGAVSILLFIRGFARTPGVSKGRALAAYVLLILLANAGYLLFALGWSALLGVV